MNKKLIQATQPIAVKKDGKRITVQIIEDNLVLNLYKDKILYCRYAMNREGTQYATFMNSKWGQRRLELVASGQSWYYLDELKEYTIDTNKQRENIS